MIAPQCRFSVPDIGLSQLPGVGEKIRQRLDEIYLATFAKSWSIEVWIIATGILPLEAAFF